MPRTVNQLIGIAEKVGRAGINAHFKLTHYRSSEMTHLLGEFLGVF